MIISDLSAYCSNSTVDVLWYDGERVLTRLHPNVDGLPPRLAVHSASEPIRSELVARFAHESALRDELDAAWAVIPVGLVRDSGQTLLLLEDPGGQPLASLLGAPLPVDRFLLLATGLAVAVAHLHRRGFIHKDLKPAHVLVGARDEVVRLTGFGIATRLPRERRTPTPPEALAGTFAYMAPEQTGRMNRTIDGRSDLYALGVMFYQMLTGVLPFDASEPIDWIHCHITRLPTPPAQRQPHVPDVVSSIVMKLLAKSAEDRYQSASGLLADLEHCRLEWEASDSIRPFVLGAHDVPDALRVREALYGREAEVARLLAAFARVVERRESRVVLVSGFSGIGKSAVVGELHRALVPSSGFFAAGKFDQFKRGVPYAPLAQAFQALVRQLLAADDATLAHWRTALTDALGHNGQLMVGLIPELQFIIGDQPPVPTLSGPEARARLRAVFLHLLGVFARPEHPLVLFLDDLQWLDSATLDIFDAFATSPDVCSLLIVGAYRDNEVGPEHPLALWLDQMRKSVRNLDEIVLRGLGDHEIAQMLGDAIGVGPKAVRGLAEIVAEKTGGNPFFAIQFLASLTDQGLLYYDPAASLWRWEIERIRAQRSSDNVVELMVERLRRMPEPTLHLLGELACLGDIVVVERLLAATGRTETEVEVLLREPLRSGLLMYIDGSYAYAHDRVHEAAYAMLTASQRRALHRSLGLRMLGTLDTAEVDEQIFEIVDQLNRARLRNGEARTAAALNLTAGRRAREAAAYVAACAYFERGRVQLGERGWLNDYPLAYALALEHAETTFLTGDFSKTARLTEDLLGHAATEVDLADAYRLKIELSVVRSDNDSAVANGLAGLRLFGIELEPHPDRSAVESAYREVWSGFGDRPIDAIAELPPMTDRRMLAAMRVLAELWPPAYFTDFNLTVIITCKMVALSLAHGMARASTQGIAWFGWLLGPGFGRYREGLPMVRQAHAVAQQRTTPLDASRILHALGLAETWAQPLPQAVRTFREAERLGVEVGDTYYACYASAHALLYRLMMGQDLAALEEECRDSLAFARATGFTGGVGLIVATERAVASLRGRTSGLARYDGDGFDQSDFEQSLASTSLTVIIYWYWTRLLMLHVLNGDHISALAVADRVQPTRWVRILHVQHLDYHTFRGIALAMACDEQGAAGRDASMRQIRNHHAQVAAWAADTGSPTFADKLALLEAELARLEGDEMRAQRQYERAIVLARQNGFQQHEGIACERTARFYEERGYATAARAYLGEARNAYLRWGAGAKVRQLEARHPYLRDQSNSIGRAGTTVAPLESLELATVVKISQALAGELDRDRLIETLMGIALEHAGAERGLLLLSSGGALHVEAEATSGPERRSIRRVDDATEPVALPLSIVQYVARTKAAAILDDATQHHQFAADPYVIAGRPRSILCMPLADAATVKGVLYLENSLVPGVFTAERITILRLIASQAAISIDNSRLYRELEEREARIRRLVDSDIIGIVIWDLDGRLIDANDAFLRIVQYERADLTAGLSWFDMTPPEWQEVHANEEARELAATGRMQPREKEYFRKDGSRVPVLIGAASFEGRSRQGVAFVLDLSERKRAEAQARESDRRFHQLQADLAHANRISMMNQLSAWISHDVRQPLVGVVASANAGLNWLSADPPNVAAAQRALERVVRDGHRAGEILDRAKGLFNKAPPRREAIEMNTIISETLTLTAADASRDSIVVRLHLAEGLPPVLADRIQLQQVILNLLANAFDALMSCSPTEREVRIETREDPRGVVVTTVGDTGPGIVADNVDCVFDAFYTTKAKGMGMGLAICRSIVESYGGRISAAARSPRGCVVEFSFPADKRAVPA